MDIIKPDWRLNRKLMAITVSMKLLFPIYEFQISSFIWSSVFIILCKSYRNQFTFNRYFICLFKQLITFLVLLIDSVVIVSALVFVFVHFPLVFKFHHQVLAGLRFY